jgi:predicted DCC family thiol-disulfide oxidoreductase YuxK
MDAIEDAGPAQPLDVPMVFDGVCNFCSASVRLVAFMDGAEAIRSCSIQSPLGQALRRQAGVDPDDPTTFLFLDKGRALESSDGMIALLGRLGAPWRWLRVMAVVPRPLRDGVYLRIARHRYRLFGKRTTCMIPTPALAARFIDTPPSAR